MTPTIGQAAAAVLGGCSACPPTQQTNRRRRPPVDRASRGSPRGRLALRVGGVGGGRAWTSLAHLPIDAAIYTRRNVVERAVNRLKEWRGIATRYDKLAITYLGGLVLATITRCWLP